MLCEGLDAVKRKLCFGAVSLEVGERVRTVRRKAYGLAGQRALADPAPLLELDNGAVRNDLGKDGRLNEAEGRKVLHLPILVPGRHTVEGKGRVCQAGSESLSEPEADESHSMSDSARGRLEPAARAAEARVALGRGRRERHAAHATTCGSEVAGSGPGAEPGAAGRTSLG